MAKFINPFTDYGFKKIFGQEVSKPLLIDFLNDLLVGEKEIKDLKFLNTESLAEIEKGRGAIYDILCTTDQGEYIIVEMQYKEHLNFKERALYYLSRAIATQGETGVAWQFNVKAVYGVFFMNFRFNKEVESGKFRTDVILADRDSGELFCDKLRQVFLELPYFKKEEEECETNFERWIYTLKNMDSLERMPFKLKQAVFDKLKEVTDVASLSKEERIKYDNSVKIYRDYLVTMEFEKQEKEAVKQEKEAIKQEKEAVKQEKEAIKQEKEAVKQEKEAVKQEKEAVKQEKEAIKQEKEAAKQEKEAAKQEKEAAKQEKEAIKQEREAIKQEKEAAKQEGKAEGVTMGEARGEAIGLEKGKQEAQLRTASELKKRGVAPEIIAQCTTLSIDEIKEL